MINADWTPLARATPLRCKFADTTILPDWKGSQPMSPAGPFSRHLTGFGDSSRLPPLNRSPDSNKGEIIMSATADPKAAVTEWFARLGKYCASVDYDSARAIFAGDVVSFGTRADIVSGLDHLQKNQWEGIWPNIQDFKIDLDSIHAGGDGRIAWGVATWTFHRLPRGRRLLFPPRAGHCHPGAAQRRMALGAHPLLPEPGHSAQNSRPKVGARHAVPLPALTPAPLPLGEG